MKEFTSYFSTETILKNSLLASRSGDPRKALKILEPVLQSKECIINPSIWRSTWDVVSEIFEQHGEQKLAIFSKMNSFEQDNGDQFYYFGYQLVEAGLYTVGLPVLKRAALLFPGDERILTELAHILEELKLYREGKETLLQSHNLVQTSFMTRYLVVFYSIMMGDLKEATYWFSGLDQLLIRAPSKFMENYEFMYENIKTMLERGKLLFSHTALDSSDLLGWNAVINGNIVLHLSEYGIESMGGRYAFYQESSSRLFSCIDKLKNVLDSLSISPQTILSLPDQDSCVLSHIAAKFFQCPVEIFSEATASLPGLIICYFSDLIDSESFTLLSEAQEGQVFWCHASNWTQISIAPDFISYFAQSVYSPWEKQIGIDLQELREEELDKKPSIITKKPLKGSSEEIAETLYKAYEIQEIEEIEEIEDTQRTATLAQVLFCDKNYHENNIFHTKRSRSKQWTDSPVSSEPLSSTHFNSHE